MRSDEFARIRAELGRWCEHPLDPAPSQPKPRVLGQGEEAHEHADNDSPVHKEETP